MNKIKKILKDQFSSKIVMPYQFKWDFKERFIRMHMHKGSRYRMNNKSEKEEALKRAKVMIKDFFLDNDEILWILQYAGNDRGIFRIFKKKGVFSFFNKSNKYKIYKNEYVDERFKWRISVVEKEWNENQFENILDILFENEFYFYMINPRKKIIFYLYEYVGGIDVIFPTEKMRNKYREKYVSWVPIEKNGVFRSKEAWKLKEEKGCDFLV